MDRQKALQILAAAGKSKEALEVINEAASAAVRRYDSIRSDEGRTDDFTRRALARAYLAADDTVTARLVALAEPFERAARSDQSKLFGFNDLPGDSASLAISARDASDRVSRLERPQDRLDLLERADRSGDEVLARAIAQVAIEHKDVGLLNRFLESRPQLEDVAQRLLNAPSLDSRGRESFAFTMALSTLRPDELSAQSRYAVEALAA